MIEQRFAGQLVAKVFRAGETGRVHRNAGRAEFLRGVAADRFDIIADQRGDAGCIDENRRRVVRGDSFPDGAIKTHFAAAHDDIELGQVRGKAVAV